MIDAYVWTTPNGYKALIALEEMGVPYTPRWVNIGKGEQMKPEFLAINPNNKIPAIVDRDTGVTVFESGAIAIYLAEKTKQLLAASGPERYAALEWVFFNVGGTGPMIGQLAHFVKFAPEQVPYAIDRYRKETERLLGVLDGRLGEVPYLAGEYSIADLMNVTWARAAGNFGIELASFRNLSRWLGEVEARPAVARALAQKPA
jgi:GSH-dependent disulfide-bond oxidoreductase